MKIYLVFILSTISLLAQELPWKEVSRQRKWERIEILGQSKLVLSAPVSSNRKDEKFVRHIPIPSFPESYIQWPKCLLLRFDTSQYLLVTPLGSCCFTQFHPIYFKKSQLLIINYRYRIELETGNITQRNKHNKQAFIGELKWHKLRQKKNQEFSKLQKIRKESSIVTNQLIKSYQKIDRLEKDIEKKQNDWNMLQEREKQKKKEYEQLENKYSRSYLEIKKYQRLIKICSKNLTYLHHEIKKQAAKLLQIQTLRHEESDKLALTIVELNKQQASLASIRQNKKQQAKKISKITQVKLSPSLFTNGNALDLISKLHCNIFHQFGNFDFHCRFSADRLWCSSWKYGKNPKIISLHPKKQPAVVPILSSSWYAHNWCPKSGPISLVCIKKNTLVFYGGSKLIKKFEKPFEIPIHSVCWHPTGTSIYYTTDRGLYQWSMQLFQPPRLLKQGNFTLVCCTTDGHPIVYSPAGKEIISFSTNFKTTFRTKLPGNPIVFGVSSNQELYLAWRIHSHWSLAIYHRKNNNPWRTYFITSPSLPPEKVVQLRDGKNGFLLTYHGQ